MSNKFLTPEVVNILERRKKQEKQLEKIALLERHMIENAKMVTTYLQAQDNKTARLVKEVLQFQAATQNNATEARRFSAFAVVLALTSFVAAVIAIIF